jgi:hypothetical protein
LAASTGTAAPGAGQQLDIEGNPLWVTLAPA